MGPDRKEYVSFMEIVKFNELGLSEKILKAVAAMGFEEASPIQAKAIPAAMQGIDLIGQAQTGTGKTAAFGIPVLEKIDVKSKELQVLVLCPTRELAIQTAEEMRNLAKYMSAVKILPIYGGQEIVKQIRSLKAGVQIVIGTPGRVMDHMRRKTLRLDSVHTVVLDEADGEERFFCAMQMASSTQVVVYHRMAGLQGLFDTGSLIARSSDSIYYHYCI